MLAVNGFVHRQLETQTIRMATGFAGSVGDTPHDLCGTFSTSVMILGKLSVCVDASEDDSFYHQIVKDYCNRF